MRLVERCHAYLRDWMAWNAVAAILLGLLIGEIAKPKEAGYGRIVDLAILTCVFLMIFPIMVTVRLEAFRQAARNLKGVGLSILFNFVWAPLVGLALASVFLDQSEVAFGFLVVMTVPCAPMSLSYTGLTKGDVELATIIVAVSFLLALASVPFWLGLLAGQFDVPMPYLVLARALVVMLVLPMVFGYLARRVLVKRCGNEGFARIAPVFPTVSMATMLANIFMIFFSMATTLLEQWTLMLWLLVPNILFMAVTFLLVTVTTRLAGFSYPENMAIAFTSTGKNNATAVAIALSTFSPMVAVPAATMPIFQIVFMILYMRLAPWLARHFARNAPRSRPLRGAGDADA